MVTDDGRTGKRSAVGMMSESGLVHGSLARRVGENGRFVCSLPRLDLLELKLLLADRVEETVLRHAVSDMFSAQTRDDPNRRD